MPSNDDDDKIIRHKISQAADEAKQISDKPITLKLWVVAAIALAAFIAGAWIF